MSGVWLRQHADEPIRHECDPPRSQETGFPDGDRGDIWRCDCGRRWVIVGNALSTSWARRWLPWPRKSWQEKIEDGALV